jgi:hypothetical protein
MKRQPRHRDVRKYAHPPGKMIRQLTIRQLAAIGAVALAYNELEVAIDILLFEVIGLRHPAPLDISCIINMEDKIAAINKGVAHLGLEPEYKKQIKEALDTFREFTGSRDAINHARIINGFDVKACTTAFPSVFTEDAINTFYDHLMALEKEISSAAVLIKGAFTLKSLAPDDSKKGFYEEVKRVCSFQFRGYSSRRRSLPPMPHFPSESELRDVIMRWQEGQQVEMMAWLSVGVEPKSLREWGEGS